METGENGWIPAIATEELPEERGVQVEAFGTTVMLYRSGDDRSSPSPAAAPIRARRWSAACRRRTGPSPTVTCPAHGSVFSLVDGRSGGDRRRSRCWRSRHA